MKRKTLKFVSCGVLFLAAAAGTLVGQEPWLDQKPIENWNTSTMRVPPAPRYSAEELERCGHTIRPGTTVADKVLEGRGWKLVGEAHVWGDTSVVMVTKGFDGMCRPYDYQVMVFMKNKVVGTLSPSFMISRSDGAIASLDLYNSHSIRAEYSRYVETDAQCCPSKLEAVFFNVDEENGVLVPGDSYIISEARQEPDPEMPSLEGTKWQWVSTTTPVEEIAVKDPAKYTLEFLPEGKATIQADCNRGNGTFNQTGASLYFSPFAVTKMACPGGSQDAEFLKNLEFVRIMKLEDGKLFLDLFADGGTMMFTKVD